MCGQSAKVRLSIKKLLGRLVADVKIQAVKDVLQEADNSDYTDDMSYSSQQDVRRKSVEELCLYSGKKFAGADLNSTSRPF